MLTKLVDSSLLEKKYSRNFTCAQYVSSSNNSIIFEALKPLFMCPLRIRQTSAVFAFISLILLPATLLSQSECANTWAVNYNPLAQPDASDCLFYPTSLEFDSSFNLSINVGTGISNEHAAIANHGPIQIGLKVNERYVGDIIPINDNNYHVLTGYSRTSFFDPTPVPGIATWDFIYSINLDEFTFNDLAVYVTIDFDPVDGESQNSSFDLPVSQVMQAIGEGSSHIKQGSENLGFNFWQALAGPVASEFDPLSPGIYDFSVRIENLAGNILAQTSISVIADNPVDGCTDENACNYNPLANVEDGSCYYASVLEDCDGNCLIDFNANGLCDNTEITGCTYSNALNFNSLATLDNGSCTFSPCNETACNNADFDNNGVVDLSDLFVFLSLYNTQCE
ncbi:MAG: hypothetical protein RL226_1584 [Bacteroidota bacterium]